MQEPLSTRTSPTRAREDGEDVLSVPDTQRLTTLFAAASLAISDLFFSRRTLQFTLASQHSCRRLTGWSRERERERVSDLFERDRQTVRVIRLCGGK